MDRFFKLAAEQLKDVTFLKYLFPILCLIGTFVFIYYGYRGILYKKTIFLLKLDGMSSSEMHGFFGEITGYSAVLTGILYSLVGIFLFFILGGISYYLIFGN